MILPFKKFFNRRKFIKTVTEVEVRCRRNGLRKQVIAKEEPLELRRKRLRERGRERERKEIHVT